MKKLIEKTWSYALYQDNDNNLIFSVLCGSSAIYETNIQFNDKEKAGFEKEGQNYSDTLAEDIRQNTDKYNSRHIQEITV